MIAAISGFLGVIVGALAATASSWFFKRREERREAKVAIRLIREDVILAGATLEVVLKSGWLPEFALPLEDWRQHRASLAAHLSDRDWNEVAAAMGYLGRIENMLAAVADGGELEAEDIPDDAKTIIATTLERLREANATLKVACPHEPV